MVGCRTWSRGEMILLEIILAATIPLQTSSRALSASRAFVQAPHFPAHLLRTQHNTYSCPWKAGARAGLPGPCKRNNPSRASNPSCVWLSRHPGQSLDQRSVSVSESGSGPGRRPSGGRFAVDQAQEGIASDGGVGVSRYPRPRWLIQARKASSSSGPSRAPQSGRTRSEGHRAVSAADARVRAGFVGDAARQALSAKQSCSAEAAGPGRSTTRSKRLRQRRVVEEGSEGDWEEASVEREVDAAAFRVGRPRGRPYVIVCDAESISHPELLECIDMVEQPGIRDFGLIYADWKTRTDWRSPVHPRSKADHFRTAQLNPVPLGSESLEENTRTRDVMKIAGSETFRDFDFCLVSSTESMADLAGRLQEKGRYVTGIGRRQPPEAFFRRCDSFLYVDPANRYELLMDEGLVMSVALCVALAGAGQENCGWVRMKTIVRSLHSWDLGLEEPSWYGYTDYDGMIDEMSMYVRGVEGTSGEVVLKVPTTPEKVPSGLEDVAAYLHDKWVSFTSDPQMNEILLSCIPACVDAVAMARAEVNSAMKRLRRRRGRHSNPAER